MSSGSVSEMSHKLPRIAVAAVVFNSQGHVLLVERKNQPGKGLWTVPGGRVEAFETLHDACLRELAEETGISGKVHSLVEVIERMEPDSSPLPFHYIILDYLVVVETFSIVASSDAADAAFFALEDVANLKTTDGLMPVIEKALALWSSL